MRKISLILMLLFCTTVMAQNQKVYFFKEFVDAQIVYKSRAKFKVKLNYDANNQKMFYMNGDVLMELVSPELVDTIFAGARKFVYHDKKFCEVVPASDGSDLLIGWWIKNVYQGQKGVFGLPTQAHVQKLRAVDFAGAEEGHNANAGMEAAQYDSWSAELDMWRQKSENTYYFTKNGQEYAIKSIKQVYKAFPDKKEQIKAYVKENNLDMIHTDKAIRIVDYLMSL